MGRSACCAKEGLNRGAWTAQEDKILTEYIRIHGEGKWRNLPKSAGKIYLYINILRLKESEWLVPLFSFSIYKTAKKTCMHVTSSGICLFFFIWSSHKNEMVNFVQVWKDVGRAAGFAGWIILDQTLREVTYHRMKKNSSLGFTSSWETGLDLSLSPKKKYIT